MARDRQRSKQRRRRAAPGGGDPAGDRAREIGLDDARLDESGLTDPAAAPDPLKNASAEVDQAHAAEAGVGRGPAGEVDLGGESDVYDADADADPAAREPAEDDLFEGEDDLERAPDRVETPSGLRQRRSRRLDGAAGDGGDDGHGGRTARGGGGEPTPRKERGRLLTFLRACVEELRRVQWPDRRHVFQATAVVLGFVLVAGGWLGLMDAIWQPLINALL